MSVFCTMYTVRILCVSVFCTMYTVRMLWASVFCTMYTVRMSLLTPFMCHTPIAHVPDRDPGEDVDGDEPDWPLFEEVCELRSGVRFSCQVSR